MASGRETAYTERVRRSGQLLRTSKRLSVQESGKSEEI